jgi:hypothetical protein
MVNLDLHLKKSDKGNKRKYTRGCSLVPAIVLQCILKNVYEVCFLCKKYDSTLFLTFYFMFL